MLVFKCMFMLLTMTRAKQNGIVKFSVSDWRVLVSAWFISEERKRDRPALLLAFIVGVL